MLKENFKDAQLYEHKAQSEFLKRVKNVRLQCQECEGQE